MQNMVDVNRVERIPYRQLQAAATRKRIAESALRLFVAQGYGSTSIESIADAAGVAVSTVYAIFRNKRSILAAICEAWLEAAEIRPLLGSALDDADVRRRVATAARWTRQQWEQGSEIVPLLHAAAQSDADVAQMLNDWLAEKSAAMRTFVLSLEGTLKPGLGLASACAIFDALTLPEVYRDLVERSSWSPDDYERWLAQTLIHQFFVVSAD